VFEEAVEVAGEVALEAAVCFASCLAFMQASFDVGDRRRMRASPPNSQLTMKLVKAARARGTASAGSHSAQTALR
jgi:hypothetical protein